jgi:hypothetical protein
MHDRSKHRIEELRVASGEAGYSAHSVSVTAYEVVVVGIVVTVAPGGSWNSEAAGEGE